MRSVVLEVFEGLLEEHVKNEHGLIGASDIENNLVKKDYSNLQTPWQVGKYSLVNSTKDISEVGLAGKMRLSTNGILEYNLQYSFDMQANKQLKISGNRYYYQKSPIWDESDDTIFSQKYLEDNMFSLTTKSGQSFNNLRYGTNVFFKEIKFREFGESFINDEYCVFFDTYGPDEFVFGYDKADLESKDEPTYDSVVSMPMLMNKTNDGFIVLLPIHTYFNSLKKYNIGVPWKNKFRVQVIGRYR